MGKIKEQILNACIADILDNMNDWKVSGELGGMVMGNARLTPDILITKSGMPPRIIEVEWEPGTQVENEAKNRLGIEIENHGKVKTVLAVKIPKKLQSVDKEKLIEDLQKIDNIKYAVLEPTKRIPEKGWLTGNLKMISTLTQMVSHSHINIIKSVEIITSSIKKNAQLLDSEKDLCDKIACILKQESNIETCEMASLVIQNAMLFYYHLGGRHKLPSIHKLMTPYETLDQNLVMNAWEKVLKINYAPIFQIAMDILNEMPHDISEKILKEVGNTANIIIKSDMMHSGDMYGLLFQKLITQRKQFAAFYTRQESATLLACTIVPNEKDSMWKDESKVKSYRIADFACGTGMLLSSTYSRMISNYEASGNDMSKIHDLMMEKNIFGFDVLPIATHIAVSNLAGIFPKKEFKQTNIMVLPLGKLETSNVGHGLGSLDLLKGSISLSNIAVRVTAHGDMKTKTMGVKDSTCDLIIMNPPFTRNTRSGIEGDNDLLIPSFGVFGISKHDQKKMSDLLKKKFKNTCYHGHAGLGSCFVAIANKKLKPDGKLGLIIPSTITTGSSWEKVRELLKNNYKNIILISINNKEKLDDMAFSADTSMSEVIIIAQKRRMEQVTKEYKIRIKNISLFRRPRTQVEALLIADFITHGENIFKIDGGKYGSTEIKIGDVKVGEALDCPFDSNINFNNIHDIRLYQFVYRLSDSRLQALDGELENTVSITTMKEFVDMGDDHQEFVGEQHNGPFIKSENLENSQYPALWKNNSKEQTTIICKPNLSLIPKSDASLARINELMRSKTHVHFNTFLSYRSQRLVALYTKEKSIGGTSLPSLIFKDTKYEKAVTLWCNSTFGILFHWFIGGKQQAGRSLITSLKQVLNVPIFDFRTLNNMQIKTLDTLFDKISSEKLLPVKDLNRDKTRHTIDISILKVMGITTDLNLIRNIFCSEPQVIGHSKKEIDY